LNSSLVQSAGELWRCKARQKQRRLRDLKENHPVLVDIAAGNPPGSESVKLIRNNA